MGLSTFLPLFCQVNADEKQEVEATEVEAARSRDNKKQRQQAVEAARSEGSKKQRHSEDEYKPNIFIALYYYCIVLLPWGKKRYIQKVN